MTSTPASAPAAAIDLGTNTALLLVARLATDGSLEIVEELCTTPRLGERLALAGTLDVLARERALSTLERFARRIDELGVDRARVRAVGTACLRRARDGAEFAALTRVRTGLVLEILPAEEEARLSALAVKGAGVGPGALVVDVGGGSTEIACPALGLFMSAPIGAVVLTEEYVDGDPPSPSAWARLTRAVERACEAFPAGAARARTTVAVGGSAVNLACVALGIPRFDPARAEGAVLHASEAGRRAAQMAALPLAERLRLPIEPERAAILPAGLACSAGTFDRLQTSQFTVTARGLRHGVVRELLERERGGLSGNAQRSRS